MKLLKKKYRLLLFIVVTTIILFFVIIPVLKAFIQVFKAPVISNPKQFVKQFNKQNQIRVFPGDGKGFSIIGDEVGYAKSPLFPYTNIFDYTDVVSFCEPDYREIDSDTVWNVFFVRISSCHWPDQLNNEYYGPYKSSVPLY